MKNMYDGLQDFYDEDYEPTLCQEYLNELAAWNEQSKEEEE